MKIGNKISKSAFLDYDVITAIGWFIYQNYNIETFPIVGIVEEGNFIWDFYVLLEG